LVLAMLLVPALQGGDGADEAPAGEDLRRLGFVDGSGLFAGLEGENGPIGYESLATGLEAVAAGTIDTLYVIPADYLQSGSVEQYAQFQGRFPSNPGDEAVFRALLTHALVPGQVDPLVTARILAPAEFENFRVEDDGTLADLTPLAEEVGGMLVPILFAALLGTGLAVGFSYMMQSVAEEKESRLVEVVITSASPLSIMGGKLLALVTVGLVQAAVWIIAAALTVPVMLSEITGGAGLVIPAGLWVTIIASFVVGYLLTATLAIFVAAVAPSTREAGRLGGWIPVLGFAPFWFSGLLMVQPDGLAAELLSYIPLFAPTGVLLRISAGGDMAAWQIAAALAGVAALSLVVLWMSARVFRAAIFMRGQNFSRHNLWAALRG
ncbi:MAG: ABC transporter permease, partial [Thermoleophilia bacterium]|nr:ABC transporter permease [Thermoleophilia bacterium]